MSGDFGCVPSLMRGVHPLCPLTLSAPLQGLLCVAVLEIQSSFLRGSTVFAITMVLQSIKEERLSDNPKLKVSTAALHSFAGNSSLVSGVGRTHHEATRAASN